MEGEADEEEAEIRFSSAASVKSPLTPTAFAAVRDNLICRI